MAGTLVDASTGHELATRVLWAHSYAERARGLIGRPSLEDGTAFVIPRARQVHTLFMGYAIDVLFADGDWRVVHIVRGMRPWRASAFVLRSRVVVELPGGTVPPEVAVGNRLEIKDR